MGEALATKRHKMAQEWSAHNQPVVLFSAWAFWCLFVAMAFRANGQSHLPSG